jgi:hypothetical protein
MYSLLHLNLNSRVGCEQNCRIWCLERGRLWRSAICDVSLADYRHRYAPPSLDGSLVTRMMTSPTSIICIDPSGRDSRNFTQKFLSQIFNSLITWKIFHYFFITFNQIYFRILKKLWTRIEGMRLGGWVGALEMRSRWSWQQRKSG